MVPSRSNSVVATRLLGEERLISPTTWPAVLRSGAATQRMRGGEFPVVGRESARGDDRRFQRLLADLRSR